MLFEDGSPLGNHGVLVKHDPLESEPEYPPRAALRTGSDAQESRTCPSREKSCWVISLRRCEAEGCSHHGSTTPSRRRHRIWRGREKGKLLSNRMAKDLGQAEIGVSE
jgi:hypothetical protein